MRSLRIVWAALRARREAAEIREREESRLARVRAEIALASRLEEAAAVSFLDRVAANSNAVAPVPPTGGASPEDAEEEFFRFVAAMNRPPGIEVVTPEEALLAAVSADERQVAEWVRFWTRRGEILAGRTDRKIN